MEYKEFIENLPKWDGKDRVTKLQQLVKIKSTHHPSRGKKSNETDWFNFLVRQIVSSGKADGVVAGEQAKEIITCLCPFAKPLIEEIADDLFSINEGTILITDAKTLHAVVQNPHYKWIMTMEVEAVNPDYKAIDVRQLYAQVL